MMAVLSVSSMTTSFISLPLPLPYSPLKLYAFIGDSSAKLRQILPQNWYNRSVLFAVTLFGCKIDFAQYIYIYIYIYIHTQFSFLSGIIFISTVKNYPTVVCNKSNENGT